jgi:hypothetical protein
MTKILPLRDTMKMTVTITLPSPLKREENPVEYQFEGWRGNANNPR